MALSLVALSFGCAAQSPSLQEFLRNQEMQRADLLQFQRTIAELHAEDEARELRAAIAQLSPSDRLFMDYYYIQELDPEVIARLMSISVNTVYSRKNKIREKLRIIVGKQQPGRTRKGEAPRA